MRREPLVELRARRLPTVSRRLIGLIVIVTGLLMAAMSALNMIDGVQRFAEAKRVTMLATAQALASGASQAVARGDVHSILQTLRAIAKIPGVLRAEVADRTGQVLAELGDQAFLLSDPRLDADKGVPLWVLLRTDAIRVHVPIVDNGERVGQLALSIDTSDLRDQLFGVLIRNGLASLAALAFGVLLAHRLQKSITRPLRELAAVMSTAKVDNDFDTVRETGQDRETYLLALAFNTMIAKIRQATDEILAREDEIIGRLARAGEQRDDQTGEHVARVATVSRIVAGGLRLDPAFVRELWRASPMHDIGKVAVPDAILFKPGPLDPDERRIMQDHTQTGYRILSGSKSSLVQLAAEIALSHHERWDGSGYPAGLSGDRIPISGRITAVADVCDALLSTRPYKKAWAPEEVRIYMRQNAGTQFDPRCVEALLANWDQVQSLYAHGQDPLPSPERAARIAATA